MNRLSLKTGSLSAYALACLLASGCADSQESVERDETSPATSEQVYVPPAEEGSELIANRLLKVNGENGEPVAPVESSEAAFTGVIVELAPEAIRVQTPAGAEELFALAEDVAVVAPGNSEQRLLITQLKPGHQVRLILERVEQENDGVIQVVREIHVDSEVESVDESAPDEGVPNPETDPNLND